MLMPTVIPVAVDDFDRWAEYFDRICAESGQGGLPLFSPFDISPFALSPERRTRFESSLLVPVRQPGWMRAWAVEDSAGRMVAHLDLNGSNIPSEMHRATLGIGCERAFYRQGIGTKLMQRAMDFASSHGIEWIDLSVFSENVPAMSLYRSLGFVETGRREDRFRLSGRSVDDIAMSLRLPSSYLHQSTVVQ